MKLLDHQPKPYHGLDEKTAYELGVLDYSKDIKQMLKDMKDLDEPFLKDMRKIKNHTWNQYQAIIKWHNNWVTRAFKYNIGFFPDDGPYDDDYWESKDWWPGNI